MLAVFDMLANSLTKEAAAFVHIRLLDRPVRCWLHSIQIDIHL